MTVRRSVKLQRRSLAEQYATANASQSPMRGGLLLASAILAIYVIAGACYGLGRLVIRGFGW